MRLSDARDHFIADKRMSTKRRRPASIATLRAYGEHLEAFIASAPSGFNSETARAFLAARSARGLSPHTLNLDSVVLREFAAWGAKRRYWRHEDVDDIPPIGKPETLPRPYASDERDRVMALALPLEDQVLRGLLYFAGLRRAEIIGLRLRDVRAPHALPDGTQLLGRLRALGKGSKERIVPINPALWTLLAEYLHSLPPDTPADCPLLHHRDGSAWGKGMIERRVRAWGAQAGVETSKAHRWRHTFATDYLDSNPGDIRTLQDLLGHSSLATTQIYTKVSDQRKDDGVRNMTTPRYFALPGTGGQAPTGKGADS